MTVEEIKNTVQPIAKKYGVERVYLFGSYARGDANQDSDIDLRIDKGKLRGMFALCRLYTELEEALNMKVDMLTTGSLDEDFLNKIKDEEVLLYAE
ncbi:nucleotidyltransferase family protein [Caproiciproducens sp. LBM24188]